MLRLQVHILTLVVLLAQPFSLPAADVSSRRGDTFNPTGYYFLSEKLIPGLEYFDYIDLSTAETKQNKDGSLRWVSTRPNGAVIAKGRYRMKSVSVEGRTLSFETVVRGGISYRFSGSFLRGGTYYENEPHGVVLRGRLVKLRQGMAVVEKEVGLIWSGGD